MGRLSRQGPLDPKDPEYYAPRRLRENLEVRRSQGARLESVTRPISPPSPFDNPLKDAGSVSLRNPLHPEVLRPPAGFAHEPDRRAMLFRLAAGFAAAAGVVAVVALFFLFRAPAAQPSDTASAPSEITGSTKAALPPSEEDELASKPALAQFKALLPTAPAGQPAAEEPSQQELQRFMQWRQKESSTEASQ